MTAPWHSAAVTDVAFHSTRRKGYQSKLLFFHSKGGRGLLHCDDRRWPWWASRDGPQRDRSRSDSGIISMDFNSYSSLVIFFIILFCFWSRNFTSYTCVGCFIFITIHSFISLPSNQAWKPLKLGLSISFSLWGFSSLLTLQRQLRRLAFLKAFVWFFCCYLPVCLFRNFTFN